MDAEIVRRSKLIVPLNAPEAVERALTCGADIIVLDPGSMPSPSKKDEAKALLQKWIPVVAKSGADVFFLIKHDFTRADLEACVWPSLDGIVFSKAESAADISNLDKIITELEEKRDIPKGTVQIDVILQTAKGIWNVYEIVEASTRVISVGVGFEELAADLGIEIVDEIDQFAYAKGRTVVAARSKENVGQGASTASGFLTDVETEFTFGIQPHGLGYIGPTSAGGYTDPKRLFEAAAAGHDEGFRGYLCTDPTQVESLNKGFSPSEEVITYANKVIEAMDIALKEGRGSTTVGEGGMVDVRTVYPQRLLLARVEAIAAKDKIKARARKLIGKAPEKGESR